MRIEGGIKRQPTIRRMVGACGTVSCTSVRVPEPTGPRGVGTAGIAPPLSRRASCKRGTNSEARDLRGGLKRNLRATVHCVDPSSTRERPAVRSSGGPYPRPSMTAEELAFRCNPRPPRERRCRNRLWLASSRRVTCNTEADVLCNTCCKAAAQALSPLSRNSKARQPEPATAADPGNRCRRDSAPLAHKGQGGGVAAAGSAPFALTKLPNAKPAVPSTPRRAALDQLCAVSEASETRQGGRQKAGWTSLSLYNLPSAARACKGPPCRGTCDPRKGPERLGPFPQRITTRHLRKLELRRIATSWIKTTRRETSELVPLRSMCSTTSAHKL